MGFYEDLENNVAKYGGADEAYKLKLKENFRDLLGYSNYMSKLQGAISAPLSLGSMKGNITPQGVKSLVSGAIGMKADDVSAYGGMVNKIDSAADTLATQQISEEKRKADQLRYDTSFIYAPQDELDQKILAYTQNPYNKDGSIKSLQQFEAELNEEYGKTVDGEQPYGGQNMNEGVMSANVSATGEPITPNPKFSQEDIKNRLVEKLPADYIGKEDTYSYRFRGFTAERAADEQIIDLSNMIANGQGDYVWKNYPELYPIAYASMTDTEKAELRGLTGGRDLGFPSTK